ncbi:MAG: AMP-binding protein [Lysobacter sp.]|nr:AMP-binding protein [Lysobacter sp.]
MNWIQERFAGFGDREMAVGDDGAVTYAQFAERIGRWRTVLRQWGIVGGDSVGLVGDYHVDTLALLQAMLDTGCIVTPLVEDDRALFGERLETVRAGWLIETPSAGAITPETTRATRLGDPEPHPLQAPLIEAGRAGLVIFTSGSTGKGKAVLLEHARMVGRFRDTVRPGFRTLLFLKLDHIGGLNTLFSVIFNGGTVVTCGSRQAKDICACIERHRVELLPTTPSFLTMLMMSGVHRQHDLSSLKVITYGTEVMPNSTLATLHRELPSVTLKQTYGLSELGILSTRSKDSSSRWMQIGGDGFEVQVREGRLWIRSAQAMLGYLNAPSPFDADGWYDTGDRVETDGAYFQILGRESEIINVAGEKVFPVEVESFLLTLDNVRDVVVRQKRSPIVGQMIWAEFVLEREEDPAAFKRRVLAECSAQLAPFKVPGHVTIVRDADFVGSRFKKIRRAGGDAVPVAADAAAPVAQGG